MDTSLRSPRSTPMAGTATPVGHRRAGRRFRRHHCRRRGQAGGRHLLAPGARIVTVVTGAGIRFVDLPGRRAADPLRGVETSSSLRIVELERTEGRTAHRHPLSEEVIYIEAGRGRVWLDGEWHPVAPGDTVHVPAGSAHATVPDEGADMRLVCFFPHPDLFANNEDTDITVT